VGILIEEIVVNVDDITNEVVLFIHWEGGRHSELRVAKHKSGYNGRQTAPEAIDVVGQMATRYSDGEIALTLNRLRLKTGTGNTWNETRVRSLRSQLKLSPRGGQQDDDSLLNLEEASKRLKVSATVVRRLIQLKILPATQIVVGAPRQIALTDADSPAVIKAAQTLQRREVLREPCEQQKTPCLPGFEDVHDRTAF
jgi:hypothetical protein